MKKKKKSVIHRIRWFKKWHLLVIKVSADMNKKPYRYPTREKYSCIDFLDPKSGILGLFGFLLPIFFKNWYFFYAFWRAAVMSNIPNQGWNSAHILEGIYVSRYLLKLKYPYKILDLCTTPSFPLREKFPCIGMTRGITRLQKLS